MSVSAQGISVGGPSQKSDMDLILEGGSNFMARVQALSDARDQASEALAQLNLGKSAQQAYDAAQIALAEAQVKQEQAAKMLADAEASSAQWISQAQDNAAKIVAEAQAQADEITAANKKERAKHNTWIKSTTADMNEKLAKANQAQVDAEEAKKTHEAALARSNQAAEAAASAEAMHIQAAADLNAKADKMAAALAAMTGPQS